MVTFDGKKAHKVKKDLPSSRNKKKPFYITTAIDYVNSVPHVGHSYQKIIADVLARWHRLKGENVFFLTGTDEHGQKVDRAAKKAGLPPKKFADEMSSHFKRAWKNLNIKPDRFIRTTDRDHEKIAQKLTEKIWKRGDIYKGFYKGLYCTGCESYFNERDAINGKCPVHKEKLEILKEETYFFRLSKYQNQLLDYYEKHPKFILPYNRRKEIINRVKEGLKDLSITRTSFSWGIPFPLDKKHFEYVWWEALINYISGINWPGNNFKKYWPADIHLLGVDNGWFHCVIWPAMLMSAGISLPKSVFIHGFLTINGEKISKSLGNVIDPMYLVKKYGSDPIRYFLLREIPFGEDGDFSEEALVTRNNDELANILGNLVHRILSFIYSKNKGIVPKPGKYDKLDKQMKLKIETTMERAGTLLEELQLHKALEEILGLAKAGNEYFQAKEPWKGRFDNCLYLGANLVRSLGIIISPYIPESSEKMLGFLNTKPGSWESSRELAIKPGHKIRKPEPLFRKLELEK